MRQRYARGTKLEIKVENNRLIWVTNDLDNGIQAEHNITPLYHFFKELFQQNPTLLEGDSTVEWLEK